MDNESIRRLRLKNIMALFLCFIIFYLYFVISNNRILQLEKDNDYLSTYISCLSEENDNMMVENINSKNKDEIVINSISFISMRRNMIEIDSSSDDIDTLSRNIDFATEYYIDLKAHNNILNNYENIPEYYKNFIIEEIDEIDSIIKAMEDKLSKIVSRKNDMMSEHYYSAVLWDRLKDEGYNDFVCAGIIGNCMAECGGNTLNLSPEIRSGDGGFYGICQWNKWYFPDVQNKSFDYQIEYLLSTINNQFGSNIDNFLNSSSPESAALSFAVWYERCADWGYEVRKVNARIAYEYFTK